MRRTAVVRSLVGGAAAVVAGVVHVVLARHHLAEGGWLGYAFVADGVILVGAGAWWMLRRGGAGVARGVVGLASALTLGAFVLSRTVGLPFSGHQHAEWDAVGVLTSGMAVVALCLSLVPVRGGAGASAARRATAAVAGVALVASVLFIAGAVLSEPDSPYVPPAHASVPHSH